MHPPAGDAHAPDDASPAGRDARDTALPDEESGGAVSRHVSDPGASAAYWTAERREQARPREVRAAPPGRTDGEDENHVEATEAPDEES